MAAESTANTATSWRLRVRSYLLTSSTARRRQWTRGTEMVWGGRLRDISAQALIATGNEDVVIPPFNALKLVNALPGAWLAQFPGSGHAFMAQYPRPLADLT